MSTDPQVTRGPQSHGVTAAGGFRAAGVAAGLKSSGSADVALVVNDGPRHDAAAVFTTNRVKAAPVLWTAQCALEGRFRAVILNSGGANACTGPAGFADTHRTAEHVAELLGVAPIEVAVCSTGLIGERLPMTALLAGAEAAARGPVRRGRSRGGRGHHDDRLGAEDGRVPAPPGLDRGRDGQGRGDARARVGHHARGAHHRRRGRCGHPRRCPALGHPSVLRPDRLRRLHVHERHRPAARLRGQRDHAGPDRAGRGGHGRVRRPRPPAHR